MQAVILAAGRGIRMKELTDGCPKPMIPVLGKPILAWKIEMLPKSIDEVILIIGYLGESIREYFGDEWQGRRIRYVEQAELNGTAGATALVKPLLTGPVLVMNGDDLYAQADLERLIQGGAALLVCRLDNAFRFGIIETTEDGHLAGVKEQPHGRKEALVSTNGALLPRSYFDIPMVPVSSTEYGLPQTLASLAKKEPVKVLEATAWQPIGHPEDMVLAEDFLRKHWAI